MFNPMGQSNPEDLGNGGTIDGDVIITGDLEVNGGIGLSLSEVIQGTSTIDINDTEALLVRKNGDGGDVFVVDTTNSRVGIGTSSPSALVHLTSSSTDGNIIVESTHASSSAVVDIRSVADRDSSVLFREGTAVKARIKNDASADALVLTDGADTTTLTLSGTNATFAGDVVLSGTTKGIDFSGSGKHIISGSGSGSYIEINNLGQIKPNSNNAHSLGTSSARWSDVHTQEIHANSTVSMTGGYITASGGTTPEIQLKNNTATSSTNGTATISFVQANTQAGGKIVSGRDGNYSSGATSTSHLKFYTATNATNTLALTLDSSNNATFAGKVIIGNDQKIAIKDTNGTAQTILNLNGSNVTTLGTTSSSSVLSLSGTTATFAGSVNIASGLTTTGAVLNLQTNEPSVVANNVLGKINFQAPLDTGADSDLVGASIHALATATFSDTVNSTDLIFSTGASETATEEMRITSAGNIGVGTSSPNWTGLGVDHTVLSVGNPSAGMGMLELSGKRTSTAELGRLVWGNNTTRVAEIVAKRTDANNSADLLFKTMDAGSLGTRLTIADDGNVGIGTSPSSFDSEANNLVVGTGSGDNGITIYTGSSAGHHGSIFFGDGTGTPKQGQIRYEQNNEVMSFFTNTAERMRIDATGNVGIGVTPETSHSSVTTLQVGGLASLSATTAQSSASKTWLGNNVYIDSSGAQAYIVTDEASVYKQNGGKHNFQTVASGSADASISFTTNMVIDINSHISLSNNDASDKTTLLGYEAGSLIASGHDENTMIGHEAGLRTTGGYNTYVGANAGLGASGGDSFNVGIGRNSLFAITAGNQNTVVGNRSGLSLTTGIKNVFIGSNSGNATTDVDNTVIIGEATALANMTSDADGTVAIGSSALAALTSGGGNIAVGFQAGLLVTDNTDNVMIGHQAFNASDSGDSENVVIGSNAGGAINNGGSDGNVLIGLSAGLGGTGAMADCVAIGKNAMKSTAGNAQSGTVAIGKEALNILTTGTKNLAIGYQAGLEATIEDFNTYVGYRSGYRTAGFNNQHNTFIGYNAGSGDWVTTLSSKNTAIGSNAMIGAMNSSLQNSAMGYASLSALTTGNNNIGIGVTAGDTITTGGSNTVIGSEADVSASGATNQTVIGYGATGVADNSVTLGNASVTNLYIAKGNNTSQTITFQNSSNTGGDIQYDHSDDQMKFGVNNGIRARLFADTLRPGANDTQDLGTASAGWRTLYVTDGVNFPDDASSNPSSDANTLDSYEEGTWTPRLADQSGNLATSASGNGGTYTKVGRVVTANGVLATNGLGSVNGDVLLSGLPFACANITYNYGVISVGHANGLAITAGNYITGYNKLNATTAVFRVFSVTTGQQSLQHSQWTDDGSIVFSITYFSA